MNSSNLPPPVVDSTEPPRRAAASAPAGDSAPDTLFGLSFDGISRAQQFTLAVQSLAGKHQLRLVDLVMVVKDPEGRVVVRETIDPQPGRSALTGAMWSGLLGLIIGGPVGWVAGIGVGATTGALAAKVIDLGIPDEWISWFKDSVTRTLPRCWYSPATSISSHSARKSIAFPAPDLCTQRFTPMRSLSCDRRSTIRPPTHRAEVRHPVLAACAHRVSRARRPPQSELCLRCLLELSSATQASTVASVPGKRCDSVHALNDSLSAARVGASSRAGAYPSSRDFDSAMAKMRRPKTGLATASPIE